MIKGLNDEDRREIVKYRLEKSLRTYNEAVGSIANGYVETAANRLYYSAYYAVSALLVSFKYEASTHNGVIQMFGKAFIKSKILDRKYGTIFNRLFSLRMTGDYEDRRFLDIDVDVKPLIEPTRELIEITSELAHKQLKLLS